MYNTEFHGIENTAYKIGKQIVHKTKMKNIIFIYRIFIGIGRFIYRIYM